MVNTEEFTKRLHEIMKFHDLSAAAFADRIEVGRSSISHLLSGRNKPSLEFVMKIVDAFPDVELYWLLNGKGNYPKRDAQEPRKSPSKPPLPPTQPDLFQPPQENAPPTEQPLSQQKEIRRIVLFYNDGTFEAFEN